METSDHPGAVDALKEIRRNRMQLLPDPMELAKLAALLNPELAAGDAEKQRSAIHLARSLFDLAVESAETPTAAEISRAVNATMVVAKSPKIAEPTTRSRNSFALTEDGYEELRAYLKTKRVPPPKSFDRGRWRVLLDEYSYRRKPFRVALVSKEHVDAEIDRIRSEDADRKRTERANRPKPSK